MTRFSDERDKEKLDTITGSRGDRCQQAVRIEDLVGILQLSQIQAKSISAAPTPGQYNTLLRDVQNVAKALDAVSKALQGKLRP